MGLMLMANKADGKTCLTQKSAFNHLEVTPCPDLDASAVDAIPDPENCVGASMFVLP